VLVILLHQISLFWHELSSVAVQAIVDKAPVVASAVLVSALHLLGNNAEIVKRWTNEIQEAVNSKSSMVQVCSPFQTIMDNITSLGIAGQQIACNRPGATCAFTLRDLLCLIGIRACS